VLYKSYVPQSDLQPFDSDEELKIVGGWSDEVRCV